MKDAILKDATVTVLRCAAYAIAPPPVPGPGGTRTKSPDVLVRGQDMNEIGET